MRRMGCFGILIIVLLAVVAYDRWQIEQLRAEVAAIANKVHASKAVKGAAAQPDLTTALAEAQKYTRQAKQLLASDQVAQAQARLDKALHKLNSANGISKDIVGDTAQFLGKAKDNAVNVFQKAWKDMSEEPSPKSKVESQKSKVGSPKPAAGSAKQGQ